MHAPPSVPDCLSEKLATMFVGTVINYAYDLLTSPLFVRQRSYVHILCGRRRLILYRSVN